MLPAKPIIEAATPSIFSVAHGEAPDVRQSQTKLLGEFTTSARFFHWRLITVSLYAAF